MLYRTMSQPPTVKCSLLIRHGHLLTMNGTNDSIADGAIAIDGRRIVGVGPDLEVSEAFDATQIVSADGGVVHAGLVDSHVHTSYQLIRGLIPDDHPAEKVFDDFERPFYDNVRDEDEYSAVLLASIEMLRNGTTTFLEAGTVLEPSAAADAAMEAGIRAVIADARIVDPGDAHAVSRAGDRRRIDRSPKSLDEVLATLGVEANRDRGADSRVTGHVAVHGLGTASDVLLAEAKRRADEAGTVLNMHHAYSPDDSAADRERYGDNPLQHLSNAGVLGSNVTLSHANFVSEADRNVIVEKGVSVAWAPAASMMWGIGGAIGGHHADLWRRGANIGLASDSANWSNDFDVFRQADLALLVAREASHDRSRLTAEDVLRMATVGGARACGLDADIGVIEVGRKADIVIHSATRPEMNPPISRLKNLIQSGRSKSVSTVIVDGELVLLAGAFVRLDERAIVEKARSASSALRQRMGV